ncbi:MAG: hypothetical protein WCC11_05595 [Gammaproteobacteria bacterium]
MSYKILKFARLSALVFALVFTACAGVPVQEMSNARQAVAAARQVGAEHAAAKQMANAEQLLRTAQAALDQGNYGTARADAIRARDAAVQALRITQEQTSGGPVPP